MARDPDESAVWGETISVDHFVTDPADLPPPGKRRERPSPSREAVEMSRAAGRATTIGPRVSKAWLTRLQTEVSTFADGGKRPSRRVRRYIEKWGDPKRWRGGFRPQ